MTATTRAHEYEIGGVTFDGALVWDEARAGRRPCVPIFHGWEGRSDAQVEVGELLARADYAAFACDLFGKGVRGDMAADNSALIAPFLQDRARLLENVAAVRALPEVRPDRLAAIGFCFGGLCVLDLARSGADLRAVVSFHGLFVPPQGLESRTVKAKVMAYHGWDDPVVPPAHVDCAGCRLATPRLRRYEARIHGARREPTRGRHPVRRTRRPPRLGRGALVPRRIPGRLRRAARRGSR